MAQIGFDNRIIRYLSRLHHIRQPAVHNAGKLARAGRRRYAREVGIGPASTRRPAALSSVRQVELPRGIWAKPAHLSGVSIKTLPKPAPAL
jgi:hypothetical protein